MSQQFCITSKRTESNTYRVYPLSPNTEESIKSILKADVNKQYMVSQGEDNLYYLHHYLSEPNSKDPFNTLVFVDNLFDEITDDIWEIKALPYDKGSTHDFYTIKTGPY